MDLMEEVHRLCEQGCSQKEISRRLNISYIKVRKILVTIGDVETEESKLFKEGLTMGQIAEKLKKSRNAVCARIPYEKCVYNAENASKNAQRIREHRKRKRDNEARQYRKKEKQ